MDINLLFKIAAIGILVAVLHQVLVRAERVATHRNKVSSKEMFFFMGVIFKIYRFTYSVTKSILSSNKRPGAL